MNVRLKVLTIGNLTLCMSMSQIGSFKPLQILLTENYNEYFGHPCSACGVYSF